MTKVLVLIIISMMSFTQPSKAENKKIIGRLIEATCNMNLGIAEITFAVWDKGSKSMYRMQYNLVSSNLCLKSNAFGTPIVDMAMQSIFGTDYASKERQAMHLITINEQNIAVNVQELMGSLMSKEEYNRFNLLNYPAYPMLDNRLIYLDRIYEYTKEDLQAFLSKASF